MPEFRPAIRRHRGGRILITFGAGHKYWLLEQLRERDDVRLLDVREFLPKQPMTTPAVNSSTSP